MKNIWVIFKRELAAYFTTPIAYVFLVIFLFLSGIFMFEIGNFFGRGQADLQDFFLYHPWLYLFLIPALSMRIWAEERKTGTIELLLTLPVSMWQAVLGKFLATWVFCGIALLLTIPLWITVNILGNPDNGVIVASYIGSWIMAGAYLSIGAFISTLTKNQVIAFVVTAVVCLLFVLSGFPVVLNFFTGWMPEPIVEAISSFSFLTHFNSISKGVIEVRDAIFFCSVIVFFLFLNAVAIEHYKAD